MYAIVNDQLINKESAWISPFSPGVQYGYGVFETIKVYCGEAIFLQEHFARMKDALAFLQIEQNMDIHSIAQQSDRLIKANQLDNGHLKIICMRGEQNAIQWVFTSGEKQYKSEYQRGYKICLSTIRRNESSPLCRIKSLNYLENILQHDQAIQQGFDEAVFLNTQGQVCEGTISNIFWLKDHHLFTPSVACGLLPGIVRQKVIDLCTELEMVVSVGIFGLDDVRNAEAVFLTNSLMDIMPVNQFENKTLKQDPRNEILKLMDLYKNRYYRDSFH